MFAREFIIHVILFLNLKIIFRPLKAIMDQLINGYIRTFKVIFIRKIRECDLFELCSGPNRGFWEPEPRKLWGTLGIKKVKYFFSS